MITQQLAATNAMTIDSETGRISAAYADLSGNDFESEEDMRNWIINNLPTPTNLQALLLSWRLANDPLFNSLTDWNGRKCVLDPEQQVAANVCKLT